MVCKTVILYKVKAKEAMCILYHSVAKHSNFSKLVLFPAKVNTGLNTHACTGMYREKFSFTGKKQEKKAMGL